jgi:hypothetical protein
MTMKTDCGGLAWNSETSKHYGAAKTRQRRDFLLGQIGRDPLQTDVGETDGLHRAAQSNRATGGKSVTFESKDVKNPAKFYFLSCPAHAAHSAATLKPNDAPDLSDSALHAVVPQPTVEGAPPIRNLLAITIADVSKPFSYYFGACWSKSGDFTNHVAWENYVRRFAERRAAPLQVTIGN